MEILVTLKNINNLNKAKQAGVSGVLYGGPFSLRFNYSLYELKIINTYCKENNLKQYISIDTFIFEDDKVALYEYFELIKEFNVDGIYFTDLAIISIAREYKLDDKLIYDGDTLMTNTLDSAFYLNKGIDVVLARELTYEEIMKILAKHKQKVDMQVFGHLKMSYSKRKFLSNYFKHIDKEINVQNKKSITLKEESRMYTLPIVEDKYGTRIYTDYVLLIYKEMFELSKYLKRAIFDDTLIKENELVFDVIKDIKRLSLSNLDFLYENIIKKYKDINFSSGYLYEKTGLLKEEE